MVAHILLAAITLCLPAFVAAQTDTGPGSDVIAIRHLIGQYTKL